MRRSVCVVGWAVRRRKTCPVGATKVWGRGKSNRLAQSQNTAVNAAVRKGNARVKWDIVKRGGMEAPSKPRQAGEGGGATPRRTRAPRAALAAQNHHGHGRAVQRGRRTRSSPSSARRPPQRPNPPRRALNAIAKNKPAHRRPADAGGITARQAAQGQRKMQEAWPSPRSTSPLARHASSRRVRSDRSSGC